MLLESGFTFTFLKELIFLKGRYKHDTQGKAWKRKNDNSAPPSLSLSLSNVLL